MKKNRQTSAMVVLSVGLVLSLEARSQNRVTPGASSSKQKNATSSNTSSGAAKTDLPAELRLGDYVELDESIKNDMYGTIDFPNAELKDIVKAISQMAGKNFILDRKIENRRITILSPEAVTKQQAYNAFLSALYMNDLTLVSLGKFLKVVEAKSAIQSNIRVFTGDYVPNSEEVVTVLYKLSYLDADEIQRFVQDLVPRNGRVTSYPSTNTLVMTDTGLNLRRIIAVLKSIDVQGNEGQLESIPIRYASAKGLATLVEEILDAQGGGSSSTANRRRAGARKTRGGGSISKIVPDERTNALVVFANGRGLEELKSLISQLDTPGAGTGNIHVYYCRNALAEELATTLNSLISSQQKAGGGAAGGGRGAAQPATSFISSLTPPAPAGGGDSGAGISLDGNIKITADKATNSLVIVASGSDFSSLKQVIQKLDLPRRQVYVEATIMEILMGNNSEFGMAYNVAAPGVARVAGFNPSTGPDTMNIFNPSSLTGMVAGFATGAKYDVMLDPTSGKTINISSVIGLIRALQNTKQAQILNQPQILTSDNEEAEINITSKIATVTQTVTAGSSGGSISTPNISKDDVTISLKLKPQISEDNDLVKMAVEQSLDNFSNAQFAQNQAIDVTKRKAKTTVVVRGGDTVVVGGLQKNEANDNRSKLPILGDLPVIGWLFKGKKSDVTRSNLVLFLTPHIINEYKDLVDLTGKKLKQRDKLAKDAYEPKDLLAADLKEIRETNEKDKLKPRPRGWSFKPSSMNPPANTQQPQQKPDENSSMTVPAPDSGDLPAGDKANPPPKQPIDSEPKVPANSETQPSGA